MMNAQRYGIRWELYGVQTGADRERYIHCFPRNLIDMENPIADSFGRFPVAGGMFTERDHVLQKLTTGELHMLSSCVKSPFTTAIRGIQCSLIQQTGRSPGYVFIPHQLEPPPRSHESHIL